jgi:hypothetical protein
LYEFNQSDLVISEPRQRNRPCSILGFWNEEEADISLRYSQANRGISRAQSWTSQRLGYAKELVAADYGSAVPSSLANGGPSSASSFATRYQDSASAPVHFALLRQRIDFPRPSCTNYARGRRTIRREQ